MAPTKPKDRMRKYRENLSEDAKAEIREKDRQRKISARAKFTALKRKEESLKSYQRVKNRRERLKRAISESIPCTSTCSDGDVSPKKSYRSPQSLGKALKKVSQFLPKSPNKKIEVISKLAKAAGLFKVKLAPKKFLHPNTKLSIIEFYQEDNISRQAPGQKDSLAIRDNGTKYRKQKRHMYFTVKETHELFKLRYPNLKLGVSKFASLRPKHVLLSSQTPHNVCQCIYHSNIELLLDALTEKLAFPKTTKCLAQEIVCSANYEECMLNCCIQCKDLQKFDELQANISNSVKEEALTWLQWTVLETGVDKILHNGTVADVLQTMKEKVPKFLEHCFIQIEQFEFFNEKKLTVKENVVVLQVDFSENFTLKFQDEIQSAHWNNEQVTLYTAVAWLPGKNVQSFVVVSNYLHHDKYAVHAFHKVIIADLKNKLPQLREIHIFSDGASQHFKQKFNLCNITYGEEDHGVQLNWHFLATSHGKGAPDGVGGQLKYQMWQKIKARQIAILDAESFAAQAKKFSKSIIFYVRKEEIEEVIPMLSLRFEKIRSLPATHTIHCVTTIRQNVIKISTTSKKHGTDFYFINSNCDSTNSTSKPTAQLSQTNLSLKIIFGSWVIVKIITKKGNVKHFVGQIISTYLNLKSVEVKFLKKGTGYKFYWPEQEDYSEIDVEDIICILQEPNVDSRERLTFSASLESFSF